MKVLPCATSSWPLVEGAAGDRLDASLRLIFPCVARSVENNLVQCLGFTVFLGGFLLYVQMELYSYIQLLELVIYILIRI